MADNNNLVTVTGTSNDSTFTRVTGSNVTGGKRALDVIGKDGVVNFEWDYVAQTQAATTDTWVFRTGGAGGTVVATIVITYTDATKNVILNVAKT
jgi:hypothetical protein